MQLNLLYFFILTTIWLAINGLGENSLPVMFAVISPLLVILISNKLNIMPKKYPFNRSLFSYFVWLLKEIFFSSLAVSKLAWQRNIFIQPVLKPVKTKQNNLIGTTIYANSITLTPGTVTLSQEGDYLLVHALDSGFMDDLETGNMAKKVSKIINSSPKIVN